MRKALQKNVFYFSGMKTHAQMAEASSKLLDENGNLKPLQKFTDDVKQINEAYNDNYLRAERNFASRSAQSAAKWQKYEQGKERYNLRYLTDNGPNVRDSHRALEFTTLPVDDPFWNEYTPPNGYNCHCFLVQVHKDEYPVSNSDEAIAKGNEATTQVGKDGTNKAAIFRFNPGKEMKVMPPDHPYTSGNCSKLAAVWHTLSVMQKIQLAGEADKCRAKKVVERMIDAGVNNITKTDVIKTGNKNINYYPALTNKAASDYNNILKCCENFADKTSEKVTLLPSLQNTKRNPAYKKIFSGLEGTKYEGMCPDILVGSKFYELEGFTTDKKENALSNMFKRGLKQSSRIIIEEEGSTDHYIRRQIYKRIHFNKQQIDEVWILRKNGKMDQVY
ncbi:MAG: hypothetical protein KIT66_05105 [Chitinophagaceae bacterium]|nr:hypothetical protein [Chitinophagaceae bacterium]